MRRPGDLNAYAGRRPSCPRDCARAPSGRSVDRTFELGEIVEAHRYMESNTHVGKIVATVSH